MDILISFTTSVGVVEAVRATKDVAVDVVNQSIVLWLKNKKIPNPGQPDRPLNNREVNRRTPPYLGVGKYAYITATEIRYRYEFVRWSWHYYETEYSGTESGSYYLLVWAEGSSNEWRYEATSPPINPTTWTYRVSASSYTSGSGSFASSYSINNMYPAGGGEPPGTMLGRISYGFQFSSFSVSFGD